MTWLNYVGMYGIVKSFLLFHGMDVVFACYIS